MVIIHFKLSELGTIDINLDSSEEWRVLLSRCPGNNSLGPDNVLAVRDGSVLKAQDLIHEGDVIDVFPALSGG